MIVDLEVNSRRYRATVTAPPDSGGDAGVRLRVLLTPLDGGEAVERFVAVHSTADGYALIEIPSGRCVDAAVMPSPAGDQWQVQLPGVDLEVLLNGRRHASGDVGGPGGEQRLVSPMPGRILRVLVEAGQSVVSGQSLVVIEAMKMENALTALRDGVVHEVAVSEGTSVEAGRLLLRLG